jgi:trk system potassium uptake protein
MINHKVILYLLGFLVLIEGVSILLCAPVSAYHGDGDFGAILLSGAITLAVGLGLFLTYRKCDKNVSKRDGYIIVSVSWIVFSIFGSLPFIFSGHIPSFTDAFFETISGFTTTGASVLNDIESLSHGILFWRSLTQWLGGMGIIVMSIAILPLLGIGGMQLFIAEVPGPTPDKLHPRIKETAQRLWGIYIIFTLVEIVLLILGGMSVFDSICHSFTTMSSGGYSTNQASLIEQSPYIQYVVTVFMFIAGTNFTLSYFALHLDFKRVWGNEEFKSYLFFTLGFTVVISLGLLLNGNDQYELCFRDAIFQVVSIITTTGFVTANYETWPHLMIMLIFVAMFLGGSAGSTGGGIKIMRIVLLIKNGFFELKRLIHPKAVIPVRFNGQGVSPQIMGNVLAFVMFYIFIMVIGVIVMSALNYDIETSFGAVAATLGNIGPGIGDVGPLDNYAHIPVFGKWFLSFLMLVGRLEIFTVLILFSRNFWKN